MSYLVLARKWRPTTFAEVTGQDHVTRTLVNAIRMNRVAHSFLFTGARGVGKTSTARILAKALNCAEGPLEVPCGSCASCLEIPEGRSLDVLEIDGASNRGIGEIRELRDGVRYAPSRDTHKIYIIDEVHMLTQEAFNALLKTLEEPPRHVVFIFATTEPQKIPVTILSRCQRFDFKRVPARILIGRLSQILEAEKIQMEEMGLHMVARESEGSVRDALSLLDRIIASGGDSITAEEVGAILGIADRRWLHQLLGAIVHREPGKAIRVIHELNHYGYDIRHFSHEVVHFIRDLLVIRLETQAAEQVTDLAESEFQAMADLAAGHSAEDFERLLKIATRGIADLTHAPFPRLVLETMVVRMASLRPLRPMDDLIKRLMILERALPEGAVLPPLQAAEYLAEVRPVSHERPVVESESAPRKSPAMAEPTLPSSTTTPVIVDPGDRVSGGGELRASPLADAAPEPEDEPHPVSDVAEVFEEPVSDESEPHIEKGLPPAEESEVEGSSSGEEERLSPVESKTPVFSLVSPVPEAEIAPEGDPIDSASQPAESLESPQLFAVEEPEASRVEPESGMTSEPRGAEEGEGQSVAMAPKSLALELQAQEELQVPLNASTSSAGGKGVDAYLAAITAADPALAGELAQAKLTLGDGSLWVRFRSNLFTGRFAPETDVRNRLEATLERFFEDAVRVEVGQLLEERSEDETRYEEDERELQESYALRREAVRTNPIVEEIADTFSGRVTRVRLIGVDNDG